MKNLIKVNRISRCDIKQEEVDLKISANLYLITVSSIAITITEVISGAGNAVVFGSSGSGSEVSSLMVDGHLAVAVSVWRGYAIMPGNREIFYSVNMYVVKLFTKTNDTNEGNVVLDHFFQRNPRMSTTV